MATSPARRSGVVLSRMGGSRLLTGVCIAMLVGVVVAAFWPFEFHPVNRVRWLAGRNGVQFYGRGMIHSLEPLTLTRAGAEPGALTIQIALQADAEIASHVGQVLSFFGQRGTETLVLGQWRTGLSVFSLGIGTRSKGSGPGVPPSRSRPSGYYEIGLDDAMPAGKPRVLTITSDATGTTIYVDQTVAGRYRDGITDVLYREPSRFVIGTSVTGGDAWTGSVYWLGIYGRGLTGDEVREDYRSLAQGETRPRPDRPDLLALYTFDEGTGTRVRNHAGRQLTLAVPATFSTLAKRLLTSPWEEFRRGEFSASDVAINVVGFVPVGLVLTLWLIRNLGRAPRDASLIAVTLGLAISVLIELVQAQMPSRTSSMTDVATNALGTALGVVIARGALRTWTRPTRTPR